VLGGDASAAEVGLRNYFLGRQGEQGLFYNDTEADGSGVADTFSQGRALLGLTTWFAATGDAEVETRLRWLIDGLAGIAASSEDYSYFPGIRYRGGWLDYALMAPHAYDGRDNYGYAAQSALPLLEYHALTGHGPALELAGRLLRHFVAHSGLVDTAGQFAGETHASGYLPMAVAAVRYAAASGDARYLDWADGVYRWVKRNSSGFGWVPGPLGLGAAYFQRWYSAPARLTCETCSLADTLELGLLLARVRQPEYWDDVERFARNQLLQNQYGAAEVVLSATSCARTEPAVRTALAGAWESFALPYRLLARPDDRRVVEGCCSGSGARALSLVWERAVERQGNALSVHLGITRDSPWAQVVSHEPATGRLDVLLREPLAVRIRVPSWAAPDSVMLWVGESQRDARREGSYLVEEAFTVNEETTLASWRGGVVLDVLPDRGPAPIYEPQRAATGGVPVSSATPCTAEGKA
jgi:hypothetical protein